MWKINKKEIKYLWVKENLYNNKPIRSTIFNFNKIVNDLDIDSNTPAS